MSQGENSNSSPSPEDTQFGSIGPGVGTTTEENIFSVITLIIQWSIIVIGIFGVIGNILNIIAYVKLGFSETIHMSYIAMTITDLGTILTAMWMAVCSSSLVVENLLARYRIETDMAMFIGLTGSWPHLAFSKTTALLTAWLSLERCLCVTFPTTVKLLITPRVTKVVLTTIAVLGCCPVAFVYNDLNIEMISDPATNYSTLLIYYNTGNNLSTPSKLVFSLYGAVYPVLSWITVSICAGFLIAKLQQSLKWRNENSGTNTGASFTRQRNMYRRETRVTRTVVVIACVFIVCSLPLSASLIAAAIDREYSATGSLRSIFLANAGISFLSSEINFSINIIVYAMTGSRFRAALLEMCPASACRM